MSATDELAAAAAALRTAGAQRQRPTFQPPRRRRVPPLVVAGATILAAAVVAGALTQTRRDTSTEVQVAVPSEHSSPEVSEPTAPRPTGAAPLKAPPLEGRADHSAVWVRDQLIVWGGRTQARGSTHLADGAAYFPSDDTWRLLPDAPLAPRSGHIAAAFDASMLVMGGYGHRDGALYDTRTRRWQQTKDAPMPIARADRWASTGDAVAIWPAGSDEVHLYSPIADDWTLLPAPAAAPDAMLIGGATRLLAMSATGSYRLQGSTWELLPQPPFELNSAAGAVAAGDAVVVWHAGPAPGPAAIFTDAEGWATLPNPPLAGCQGPARGVAAAATSVVLLNPCGAAVQLDLGERSWRALPLSDTGGEYAVATPTELISWGEVCCHGAPSAFTVTGWRFPLVS